MYFFKIFLIILGSLSLIIGIMGIVIPGLPTTPFVLLAASLYLRSSDRLYAKLISNKFIGPYIQKYSIKNGMTLNSKLFSILIMWIMIIISAVFFLETVHLILIVLLMGMTGTLVMGFIVPTVKNE
jgi:uncharacterized membrane protein YbaN (DUF454 family)